MISIAILCNCSKVLEKDKNTYIEEQVHFYFDIVT